MCKEINIAWMYPDILNLHGERGNAQAFKYVAEKLDLNLNITRINDLEEKIDFNKFDILLFNSGELKVLPIIIEKINNQRNELDEFIKNKKTIIATGTTGAMLGNEIKRCDGSSFTGLKLLDMDVKERKTVIGDDLYFTIDDMEVLGSQIQMIDIKLNEEKPLGILKYGYGNNGYRKNEKNKENKGNKGDAYKEDNEIHVEGARKDNIIFTNCLGPVFVKNPWFTEKIIKDVCKLKNIEIPQMENIEYEIETKSLESIKEFINKKICQ